GGAEEITYPLRRTVSPAHFITFRVVLIDLPREGGYHRNQRLDPNAATLVRPISPSGVLPCDSCPSSFWPCSSRWSLRSPTTTRSPRRFVSLSGHSHRASRSSLARPTWWAW